jgi:pSer/pThr/pTyr-binding forkhead associated (FHA) protein
LKNYYAILEVPVGCSLEEIRQAYHRLVQEHLDDEAVFADLKEAYEVLTAPSRRAEYDKAAWGETFDSSPLASPASSGISPTGRCPMGAEAQCPVLQDRVAPTDTYCPECGYALAGLKPGASFDPAALPDPQTQARLEDRGGQAHPLKPGSNLVGREDAAVLIFDKTVSRQHARLELTDAGGLTVEDLNSTNGTQVNDEPLTPHVLRHLADGDRLRFGSVFLALHLPNSETPTETPTETPSETPAASASEAAAANPSADEALAHVTEMGEGSGRVFPLAPGITTFGRRPENSVMLTGDLYVSGAHAQIRADGAMFILTDVGSTNGTLLNGERLKINTPVSLDTGDVIVIGGTSLRFARLGDAEDPEETEEIEETEEEESEDDTNAAQAAETDPVEGPSETRDESEIRAEDVPKHVEG